MGSERKPIGGCPLDWDALRKAEFPVAERWAYFDHAAVAPLSARARAVFPGGVTHDTLPAIAQTGVDYASLGALTHSAGSLDLSLEVVL